MSTVSTQRANTLLSEPDADFQRFMMVLSYDGAPFNGWQIQPNDPSVQESVENALRLVLQTSLHIVGAGRTDTGVHARHITAHFDLPLSDGSVQAAPSFANLPTCAESRKRLVRALNGILQPAIAVYDIVPVDKNCHARFDAVSRTYRYFVHTVHDPFRSSRSRFIPKPPDFQTMNREALELLGRQDFTSFSKLHTDTNNNFCDIKAAAWHQYGEGHYYFEITANRFLRNMVRAIVGTLLDVGLNKRPEGHVRRVIDAMDRCSAGSSAPAHALYLWDITYPYPLPRIPLP